MTADRDPWAIPAFLRREDTPAQAAQRAEATKRAPSLNSLAAQPVIAPASRGPRRARARLSERHGRWYYTIRGGYTGGPFDTRELALAARSRAKKDR